MRAFRHGELQKAPEREREKERGRESQNRGDKGKGRSFSVTLSDQKRCVVSKGMLCTNVS